MSGVTGTVVTVQARIGGRRYRLQRRDDHIRFEEGDIAVEYDAHDPEGTIRGEAPEGYEVDLEPAVIMDLMQRGVRANSSVNWVGLPG